MTQVARSIMVIAIFLVVSTAVKSQTIVAYPSWVKSPSSGGIPFSGPYVPPEYTNQWPAHVGRMLRLRQRVGVASIGFVITWSPTSGILASEDYRSGSLSLVGVDTTLDRVYSVKTISNTPTSLVLLICGWDATNQKSVLRQLTVPSTGNPTVTPYGPTSPTNKIWSAATLIGSVLYIADLQSHIVRRYVDSGSDGVPDVLDAQFSVSIAPTSGALVGLILPFGGFGTLTDATRYPNAIVGFRRFVPRSSPIYIGMGPQGPKLMKKIAFSSNPTAALSITKSIFVGQTRVQVYGPPGTSFRLKAGPSQQWISSVSMMPKKGVLLVDLTSPLATGWTVRTHPISPGVKSWFSSVLDAPTGHAVIFFTNEEFEQGSRILFQCDKMRPGYVAHYKMKRGDPEFALHTDYRSAREAYIRMPAVGGSGSPPYLKRSRILLWLRDSQTGNIISNVATVRILHN